MKTTWIAGLVTGIGLAACSTWAADTEAGKGLTAEQQKQRSELVQKYDLNKDGVLDQSEANQMSKADKNALAKVGGIGTAKKSEVSEEVKGKKTEAKAKTEKTGKEAGKAVKGRKFHK